MLEIGDTPVSDVMVPRTQMKAVDADATIDAAIKVMIGSGFSRLPCYEETTDNIAGLVYLKDLVAHTAAGEGGEPVRSYLRDAVYVPESKKVDDLLREMQLRKFHMAVVVDEYGGTAGIVTMEDLLEEIVGEITDEFDAPSEEIEHLTDGRCACPGARRSARSRRSSAASSTATGTPWAASCSTSSGMCPNRATRSRWASTSSWPRWSTVAASCRW